MEDLAALVTRSQNGDLDAYGAIVRRFQDMAYGFAYAFLDDFHLAQDAAQEAFVEAYRDLPNLREPAAFPGWFRKIVHKRCDRLTRRKRVQTQPIEAAVDLPSPAPTPTDLAEKREMEGAVLAAVRALPEHQRTATTLFYIDGYSQNDIAEFLDVPVTTVKKRLATSRTQLKQRMMAMVDETLKSFPLPDRFADVVVQLNFVAERINPLAPQMRELTPDAMLRKTDDLRSRLAQDEDRDSVRAEAFALVREATRRAWGWPHYDIQLVAAMMLDEGWVAEEATGEGKTITCFPAAYMAALEGLRVHVVTVNDYLAERVAGFASAVLSQLGITVGYVARKQPYEDKVAAYQCDVTYGANSELGFDLLRDGLRLDDREPVQGPLDFAIIDEADTVLIDEARTPLIISGPKDHDPGLCLQADALACALIDRAEHGQGTPLYEFNPEHPYDLHLTDAGNAAAREIAEADGLQVEPDRLWNALRAYLVFVRDRDYIVQDGEVIIIDQATGRARPGRRWSEGLHQAIERREGVEIRPENEELAKMMYQEFFRRYKKLAGLTGTAKIQASLFRKTYGLNVAVVPTRRPMNRVDHTDRVYANEGAKLAAIVEEARHYAHDLARPVLVGTTAIEQGERLSSMLTAAGIERRTLNAKEHAHEAETVAMAGQQHPAPQDREKMVGNVTIATNMAGRGTDIALGPGVVCEACKAPPADRLSQLGVDADQLFPTGAAKCCIACPEYREATACAHCFKPKLDPAFPRRGRFECSQEPPCGLHVIGAERQWSRRTDDQLRARAGKQGEPGSSRFFLSLDDELMKAIADDLEQCGDLSPDDRNPVESQRVAKAIELAQKKRERRAFERVLEAEPLR